MITSYVLRPPMPGKQACKLSTISVLIVSGYSSKTLTITIIILIKTVRVNQFDENRVRAGRISMCRVHLFEILFNFISFSSKRVQYSVVINNLSLSI